MQIRRAFVWNWAVLAASASAPPPAPAAPPPAQDVGIEAVDRAGLAPADIALLEDPAYRWQRLQTEHFTVHHDQKMFAAKVARMGERFYEMISADLPNLQDRLAPARSFIFVFRDPDAWRRIVADTPGMDPWAASFVRGQAMYLHETGAAVSDKMDTLAHEMTHLVFNRFLAVRLPLWLNEGLAEYYGEFAYRDAKGMGHGKRSAFRALRDWTPLAELLAATAYPAEPDAASRFYATSKHLVGYLLLRQPHDKWADFFSRLLAGESARAALLETYGWADIAALEKEFARFAR